ncbi:cupin domain-containing protein [Aquimarina sediminis]|uniref:cupin domain-containing protein n=1 Tax=Aquimarina sediminis TaxID=2070536 RepID=UPI000CA076AB|nr:cupin domain-containing protein [Aquimarina sediminis]
MNITLQKTLLFAVILIVNNSCKHHKEPHTSEKGKTDIPVHISSDQGKEWNVFGVKITGKILSNQTNGDYSTIITETPPNGGPPVHVHKNEDELFYVLKGSYIFKCGDKKIEAKQGDFIRLPRGIPHSFINIDTITGITMNTMTPGGLENFFNDIAKASENSKLAKHEVDSIANTYGVKFIKN